MLKKDQNIDDCKPYLRWAGGKTWLIKHMPDLLPKNGFKQYHEPFLGGASIFFYLKPRRAFLSDLNSELIDTYTQIKDNVEAVIEYLIRFENTEECYYEVRSKSYLIPAKRAARFIYLNQTSFNGIYRVNLNGKYNVPYGYRTKSFFDPDNLRKVNVALSKVELRHCDFSDTLQFIKKNDLVFLDPPYTVTHNNNGFIKYNKKLFDLDAQYALSSYIDEIKRKGAYYILTNAAHDEVEKIFSKRDDKVFKLSRASLIGGKYAKRGNYSELVITNIK